MAKETNPEKMSMDELEELRESQTQFMKNQIEHLRVHAEYSKLKSDIATNILTEKMAKIKMAQLQAPVEKPEESESKEK